MIWNKISKEFTCFYDTPVILGKVSEDSYSVKAEFIPISDFLADVQPYSSMLIEKEYGFSAQKSYKIFADPAPELSVGSILKIGQNIYRVMECSGWRSGITAVVAETKEVSA